MKDKEIRKYFNSGQTIENVKNKSGETVFYEIDPALQASIPSNPSKTDSNFGLDAKYTPFVVNIS